MNAKEIKAKVSIDEVLAHYGSPLNEKGIFRCLFPQNHTHGDSHHSGSCNESRDRAFCNSQGCLGEKGADIFQVVGLKENIPSFADQMAWIKDKFDLNNRTPVPKKTITDTYDYLDEHGVLVFQTVRYVPKDFRQRRPDGKGGWIWNLQEIQPILYRLSEVIAAQCIVIVEGEKDVESACGLGLPTGYAVTTSPMGAGKWKPNFSEILRDKTVIICPDQDEPGKRHGQQISHALQDIATKVLWLDLPHGKDFSEWAQSGGSVEQFTLLLEKAQPLPSSLSENSKPMTGPTRSGNHKGLVADLAEKITSTYFFAKDCSGRLFVFQGGVYRANGESLVLAEVKKLLTMESLLSRWSSYKAQEVARFITIDVPELWKIPPKKILNLQNGLFDINAKQLLPHTPQHLSPIQLSVNFDPEATCQALGPIYPRCFSRRFSSLGV